MSPLRRDADGSESAGRSWESLSDRLIREAQERGEFDRLPLHGKPIPNRSNPYAGEMAMAFDMLANAGVAPPWIEADKDARTLLMKRDALLARAATSSGVMHRTLRRDLTALVTSYNHAAARVNAEAPGARQQRAPLALADELSALDAALDRGATYHQTTRPR